MMYRAIVRGQIRALWRGMNRGRWRPVVKGFARRFEYTFVGDHAMSGTWHTRAAMEAFFTRLFTVLPGARFTLHEVFVSGPLWNTCAATWLTVEAALPDGTRYTNDIMQHIQIRWGKVTRVRTLEDTQKFAALLERLAASGIPEAAMPRITN